MVVEAILSLGAGYQAHSLALTGFGMDSLIELVSASILVWRLRIEARGADDHAVDRAEVKAARCRRALRTALALFNRRGPLGTDHAKDRAPKSGRNHRDDHFWCSHGPVCPPKKAVGGGITELGTAGGCCRKLDLCLCACMAWAGLGGTLGVWALGWTWMDPVAALSIAYWVAREAWEAFEEVRETEGPEAQ